jgi:hypothetical protein
MIFSQTISIIDRVIIGAICLKRLWSYHRNETFEWSDLKVRFHVFMLFTLPFMLPRFFFCLEHYDEWQWWVILYILTLVQKIMLTSLHPSRPVTYNLSPKSGCTRRRGLSIRFTGWACPFSSLA